MQPSCMNFDIKRSKSWILFLLFPSVVLLFSGCLDTFIITIVPSILSAQNCFYSQSNIRNSSENGNKLIFIETSYIIACKVITRLPVNVLAGYFISKLGSEYILVLGLVIYGASLVMYVFSNVCVNFITSRIIEGVSASLTITASYSFLSTVFINKNDKSISMAFANFCYYIGICLGPFVGGYLYSTYGHDNTFLIIIPIHLSICILGLINLVNWKSYLENYIMNYDMTCTTSHIMKENKFSDILKSLLNPYILITCTGVAICNAAVSSLSTVLPQWMTYQFHTGRQEEGLVWIFGGIVYGLSELFSATIQRYLKNYSYLCPIIGTSLISISILTVSFHVKWIYLSFNMMIIFFGIGLIEYFLFPLMHIICNSLMNRKSDSIAAALLTSSNSLGYMFGALFSGLLTQLIGFGTMSMIFGFIIGFYAPFTILLSHYMVIDYEYDVNKNDAGEKKECIPMTTKLLN